MNENRFLILARAQEHSRLLDEIWCQSFIVTALFLKLDDASMRLARDMIEVSLAQRTCQ